MPGPVALHPLRGRCILVVEDDFILAEDLTMELERLGAEVIGPVPNLAGAFDVLVSSPTLNGAILDINLGRKLVFPLADVLLERRLPFVFASGHGTQFIPETYARVPCLEKPIDMRQVTRLFAG